MRESFTDIDVWKLHAMHILDSAARIRDYTGMDSTKFLAGGLVYDGVLRNMQTLAESATKLPAEIQSRFPAIHWRRIAGFRNILVHDYIGEIEPEKVWQVAVVYLPELESAMQELLPDYQPNQPKQ